MFKVMLFSRRKAGLSREAFIEMYESRHVQMGKQLVREGKIPALVDYRRNYIREDDPANVNFGDGIGFDVITEAWFTDREAFEQNRRSYSKELADLIQGVDREIFDMPSKKYIIVDEMVGYGKD